MRCMRWRVIKGGELEAGMFVNIHKFLTVITFRVGNIVKLKFLINCTVVTILKVTRIRSIHV